MRDRSPLYLAAFASAYEGSNAALLSEEGIAKMSVGTWWYSNVALILWFFTLFQICVVPQTSYAGTRWHSEMGWDERYYLIDDIAVKGNHRIVK